jgi:signal peptidase I
MKDKHSDSFETESIEESNKTLQEFISFLRDLVIIFLIVITIRVFIVTPFRINGSSMETSYHDKEYIIVDKFSYLNMPVVYSNIPTKA